MLGVRTEIRWSLLCGVFHPVFAFVGRRAGLAPVKLLADIEHRFTMQVVGGRQSHRLDHISQGFRLGLFFKRTAVFPACGEIFADGLDEKYDEPDSQESEQACNNVGE